MTLVLPPLAAPPSKQADSPQKPSTLSLYGVEGLILLPRATLSLKWTEPKDKVLFDRALANHRLLGISQPRQNIEDDRQPPVFYQTGCMGRIVSFCEQETGDLLLTVLGLSRYMLTGDPEADETGWKGFVDFSNFALDETAQETDSLDISRLESALHPYFKQHDIQTDWEAMSHAEPETLISALVMSCPFEANEKQALLEAPTLHARMETLMTLLEMDCLARDESLTPRH